MLICVLHDKWYAMLSMKVDMQFWNLSKNTKINVVRSWIYLNPIQQYDHFIIGSYVLIILIIESEEIGF